MDNPYYYAANEIITKLDRHHTHSRGQLEMNVEHLVSMLGLPCRVEGFDNGSMALLLLAGILKEHGGALKALTDAHQQLHQ